MFFSDAPPKIVLNLLAEMFPSTKGDNADGHESVQNECRRIEGRQAQEIYDLRGLGATAEETHRKIFFEMAYFIKETGQRRQIKVCWSNRALSPALIREHCQFGWRRPSFFASSRRRSPTIL
jgi:hypothetical protein